MFLIFALVILAVAVGILASVYSVFFPFMQHLGTAQDYQMAYYGALSAVERAELGLRYRSPGFQGSGGFLGSTGFGPSSDYTPDIFPREMQGLWWFVDSRTTSIPRQGMGNVDPLFADFDSYQYNQLGYEYVESFILSYDTTSSESFYDSGASTLSFFSGSTLTGVLRLPPKIYSGFGGDSQGKLCHSIAENCDENSDGIYDDMAVSRSLQGLYRGNEFEIFPTVSVVYASGMQVDTYHDNALRESLINEVALVQFTDSYTPVQYGSLIKQHNVVAADASIIQSFPFSTLLSNRDNDFSGVQLTFGVPYLLRTFAGTIYPYLEYQFTFPQPVADRFYTIQGYGRVGDYDVQIILKKPTVQGVAGSDFTVMF